MCYCTTIRVFTFEFQLAFFVFAHCTKCAVSSSKCKSCANCIICLNFLMSSAGLLFKAALLLLAQEYLVAYLLHELLENFWAAHAFCPFGAMPARLVLHAPSALQKGPCYTHTYYEGPLMLVHSAMARLKLVDGVQNWPFRIIIPKAFFLFCRIT